MNEGLAIAIGVLGWLFTIVVLLGALAHSTVEPPRPPLRRRPLVRLIIPKITPETDL